MLNIFPLSFVHMAIVRRHIFTLGLIFFSVFRNSGSRYASPSCHPQANRTGLLRLAIAITDHSNRLRATAAPATSGRIVRCSIFTKSV
jgi:hypothetical protein